MRVLQDHSLPLLPQVNPPADLSERVMNGIVSEPVTAWEQRVPTARGQGTPVKVGPALMLAGVLLLCSGTLPMHLGVVVRAGRLTATGVSLLAHAATAMRTMLAVVVRLVTGVASLALSAILAVWSSITTGMILGGAVSSSTVLGIMAMAGVLVVTGQVWLLHLLAQRQWKQEAQ